MGALGDAAYDGEATGKEADALLGGRSREDGLGGRFRSESTNAWDNLTVPQRNRQPGGVPLRSCVFALAAVAAIAILSGTAVLVYDAAESEEASSGIPVNAFSMDDLFDARFRVKRAAIAWVAGDAQGRLTYRTASGDIFIVDPQPDGGGDVTVSLLLNATDAALGLGELERGLRPKWREIWDSRCVLVPAPWVLRPNHVSNPA